MWSFSFCAKQDTHPLHDFQKTKAESFTKKYTLQYYNPAIHESAFILPGFVEALLHQNKTNTNKEKKGSTTKK